MGDDEFLPTSFFYVVELGVSDLCFELLQLAFGLWFGGGEGVGPVIGRELEGAGLF